MFNLGAIGAAVTLDDSQYRQKLQQLGGNTQQVLGKIAGFAAAYIGFNTLKGAVEGCVNAFMVQPRIFWISISPALDPKTIRAALAHDYIYRTQPDDWTRAEADSMFYDFCREDGLGWFAAQKAYWGLRLFGGKAWRDNAKELEKK